MKTFTVSLNQEQISLKQIKIVQFEKIWINFAWTVIYNTDIKKVCLSQDGWY